MSRTRPDSLPKIISTLLMQNILLQSAPTGIQFLMVYRNSLSVKYPELISPQSVEFGSHDVPPQKIPYLEKSLQF